jgi:hypothetical protein
MDFDFEKNSTVDSLDVVPEKYRELFTEGDEGKFVVAGHAKGIVADYIGTAKALAGARQEKKKASDESASRRLNLKAVEDFATSLGLEVGEAGVTLALESFVKDLQDQVKGGKQIKIDLDKIKAEFDKRLSETVATKDKQIGERDSALAKHLISNVATGALAKHKGSVDLLLPHVQSQAEVVRDDEGTYSVRVKDADGSHRMNGSGGWMGVDELVAEMKTKEAFARAFESEVAGGTGSRPGSMRREAPRQANRELSAIEKISAGLKKGQHQSGRGSAAR